MTTLLASLLLLGGAIAADPIQTLKKDFVIVGGGSAGVYAAIQLTDAGKDVTVIETSDFIGSHANTYYDPSTGEAKNVGVQSFHNTSIVRDYLARLNVTAIRAPFPSFDTVAVDFATGEARPDYTSPPQAAVAQGFQTFSDLLAEKYAYLDAGYFLPDPIPEELFLPFTDFAAMYNFSAIIPSIVQFIEPVEIWKEPTLSVIKNFGLNSTLAYLEIISLGGGFRPNDVNDLYRAAEKELSSKILYNSSVASVNRTAENVTVLVNTPAGEIYIEAGKIIMTAPQFINNFQGWDLSESESSIFSKFKGKNAHIAIYRAPGFNNILYTGVGGNETAQTAVLPGVIDVNPTNFTDNSYYSYVESVDQISVEDAQALFFTQMQTLQANGVIPESELEIVEWFNHNFYMNYVELDDVRAGFYNDLNNLQGVQSTFYAGAIFAGQDSSYIWAAIQALLPRILE